jgi:hypothetical protein
MILEGRRRGSATVRGDGGDVDGGGYRALLGGNTGGLILSNTGCAPAAYVVLRAQKNGGGEKGRILFVEGCSPSRAVCGSEDTECLSITQERHRKRRERTVAHAAAATHDAQMVRDRREAAELERTDRRRKPCDSHETKRFATLVKSEVAPRAGDGLPPREASHSVRSSTSVILSRHRTAAQVSCIVTAAAIPGSIGMTRCGRTILGITIIDSARKEHPFWNVGTGRQAFGTCDRPGCHERVSLWHARLPKA